MATGFLDRHGHPNAIASDQIHLLWIDLEVEATVKSVSFAQVDGRGYGFVDLFHCGVVVIWGFSCFVEHAMTFL